MVIAKIDYRSINEKRTDNIDELETLHLSLFQSTILNK